MLITPRVSEKSYKLATGSVYVFDVPLGACKAEVIAELIKQYPDIKIADVRLMVTKGKPKAVNRGKRSRPGTTTRKDTKKAYVTLREGKIEIAAFSEIENQAKADAAGHSGRSVRDEPLVSESRKSGLDSGSESGMTEEKTKKAGLFAKRRTGRRGDK